ncbi:uncharacterized protein UV8b_03374 [Ustilaginoidea virens]|uniref:N-acetyltransferase domain-containing protein n=1 Tax=Ustilaginoidea virens TaxID=1159556 RepID=A0A8E5HPR8_USTVR|nr:uncharacterized protein UV8b_03374 [Ustilaginoidea virens]QUC19133.1 hypothetical protein UV8b_03374 [Ustilaginoidea virens]
MEANATHNPSIQPPAEPAHQRKSAAQRNARPPPELPIDDGLVLRRWSPSDAAALHSAASSSLDELARWMPWAADGYGREQAQGFLEFTAQAWDSASQLDYALVVDGQPSGSFGLMRARSGRADALEVGYWLATRATGRGMATRAVAVLTRTAFAMGAELVQIRHDALNVKSAAVPRRLGFTCVGVSEEEGGVVLWQMEARSELHRGVGLEASEPVEGSAGGSVELCTEYSVPEL